ncbi:MAG: AAA family ATPase, partial [Lactiplantibacillus plantarum]
RFVFPQIIPEFLVFRQSLDEVETSLHPGAQSKITKFLLNLIIYKKLQVVISTHSPQLVKDLPEKAIKNVYFDKINNSVNVKNKCLPSEAFNEIGFSVFGKCNVYVEDLNAKLLCKAIIADTNNTAKYSTLNIEYGNGADDLVKRILSNVYKKTKNEFFILDGDKKNPDIDINHVLSLEESKNSKFLKDFVSKITNTSKYPLPSNPKEELRIEYFNNVISFWKKHVFYLPDKDPETIIWNIDTLTKLCDTLNLSTIPEPADKKHTFKSIANECNCTEQNSNSSQAQYETVFKMIIKSWLNRRDCCYNKIISQFNDILLEFNSIK